MTTLPATDSVQCELAQGWLTVWFNQPERRNPLTDEVVADLQRICDALQDSRDIRGLTLRGRGGFFCAGGDLKGFQAMATASSDDVIAMSETIGRLLYTLDRLPLVTVAVIEGAAMAGGLGVACCCDVTIGTADARFAFSETRIGISPAQIARYVMQKCGHATGRRLMLSAARFQGEVAAARMATGLPVHGVVDSTHWNVRLSDPDPEVRTRAVADLRGAIQHAHAYGGSAVLLVPGAVRGEQETQEHVWSRSVEGIRQVLPLCARLGIHVLIENVWNGFCYQHGGPEDQTAETLRDYLDAVNSPWVGSYFDIGNHQKYGRPADWIRTLGSRIVKLDVKDWGKQAGFSKIGAGDVDWEDVRAALGEIGYTGWATAEVGGGDVDRLAEVHANMTRCLRAG